VGEMLFRRMKGVDAPLSILGFGAMRLPVCPDGSVDEAEAIAMIRYAIDHGVNYVDTAYPYHEGASEVVVGKALAAGYRDRTFLATKLPSWLITKREDMDRYLSEQLARLRTDQIDFYLVHGLSRPFWENLSSLKVTEFLDDAIADGRIRFAGFSFHDTLPLFREIVDAYDWTFAQIQYNFMDEDYQAGTAGLKYAARKGLGVVVMEPLRGGFLAKEVPGVTDAWNEAPVQRAPAEWALRWVWNHPEVTVVLSGMSAMEQVKANIRYAGAGLPGSLTPGELALVGKVRAAFQERIKIPCTGCGYCMPCPSGVNIRSCFELYNQAHMFLSKDETAKLYAFVNGGFFSGVPSFASCCTECGECEEKCPQGLSIKKNLKDVVALFGK